MLCGIGKPAADNVQALRAGERFLALTLNRAKLTFEGLSAASYSLRKPNCGIGHSGGARRAPSTDTWRPPVVADAQPARRAALLAAAPANWKG